MCHLAMNHAVKKLWSSIKPLAALCLQSPGRIRMFRRDILVIYVVALMFLLCGTAIGQNHYLIDPNRSEVHFLLGGTAHEVHGVFRVRSGELGFDRKTGEMNGTVIVDAGSGNSDSGSRDKKMTNDELKAKTFPSITFAPSRFTGMLKDEGDSSVQIEGTFTLLGQPHVISVPMVVHIEGDQCTSSGSFIVPYVSWGMKDPSVFVLKVAKEVKIDLKLAGSIK